MHTTRAVRIVEVDPEPANAPGGQQFLFEDLRFALPVCDKTLRRLVSELEKPAVDLARTLAIVRSDASLAFQILGLSNSAGSLEDCNLVRATVLTGIPRLRAMASRISAANARRVASPECLSPHSQLAGTFARMLAQQTGVADAETAYLGGLLHDIGKLVSPFTEAGDEHTRVGAWLSNAWGIPQVIAESSTRHHDKASPTSGVLACVKVANSACNLFGVRSEAFAFGPYKLCALEPLIEDCLPGMTRHSILNLLKTLEAVFLDCFPAAWSILHYSRSQTFQGGVQ